MLLYKLLLPTIHASTRQNPYPFSLLVFRRTRLSCSPRPKNTIRRNASKRSLLKYKVRPRRKLGSSSPCSSKYKDPQIHLRSLLNVKITTHSLRSRNAPVPGEHVSACLETSPCPSTAQQLCAKHRNFPHNKQIVGRLGTLLQFGHFFP